MNGQKAKAIKRYVYGNADSSPEARRYIVNRPEGKFWLTPVKGQELTLVHKLQKLQVQADPLRQAYQHAKRGLKGVPISDLTVANSIIV